MKFTIFALAGALASANAHKQLRKVHRKLDGENARDELDGSAQISFAKCIEVTVQPDDDEDIQYAIQSGYAKPVKSFAAFYTNVYANDNEMMMVGLGDYVAAKVKSSAMKTQQMCESCREFEETCNPEEEEVEVSVNTPHQHTCALYCMKIIFRLSSPILKVHMLCSHKC